MQIKTTKLLLASGLTNIILYRLSKLPEDNSSVSVEAFQNGRESGTQIYVERPFQPAMELERLERKVTITESRSTDNIVVYHENFSNQGLSEEAYKNAESFNYNDYSGVIDYCVSYLTGKSL